MKAAVLTEYGDATKMEMREFPEPKPGANDVKIRVAAASINPVDWKLRSGALQKLWPLPLPCPLGRDASGEVVEVGANVKDFKVGDRVTGLAMNTYAQFVSADANAWALVPARMDLRDAAALPLVALTGVQLIEETIKLKKGDTVLVTGALGGVGRAAVYAAKRMGAKVLAGVRLRQAPHAQKLGADEVVALDDPASMEKVRGLDAVADTVGGETAARLVGKMKSGGVFGCVAGEPAGGKAAGIEVRSLFAHPDSKRLAQLVNAVDAGELVIPVEKRFPLAQFREATQLAEKGGVGKVLLTL